MKLNAMNMRKGYVSQIFGHGDRVGGGGDEEFDLDQAHLPPDVCVSVCVHVCMCECVDEYKHACVWKACGD